MAHTDVLANKLADLVGDALVGFRYYKSRHQFLCKLDGIVNDVIINMNSRSGASYSLTFYFGVQHVAVEQLIADIKAQRLTPYDRTVFQYSHNIHENKVMKFGGPTVWSGMPPSQDLSEVAPEVTRFLVGFVLPYHQKFSDLLLAREHLARSDGWVLNHTPHEQVLAIDAILSDGEHASTYLDHVQERADGGYRFDKSAFNTFYAQIRSRYPSTFPEFVLT